MKGLLNQHPVRCNPVRLPAALIELLAARFSQHILVLEKNLSGNNICQYTCVIAVHYQGSKLTFLVRRQLATDPKILVARS